MKNLLTDIRFWIFLAFIVRLYAITSPPIEVAHNWRQTTVTMPARNFYEVDNNIFYPRLDIAGEKTGITGMEFPLFNYLIYLVSLVFGYSHWYGRLINLVVSSFGLYFFYLLVKKYFTPQLAFNAGIVLLVSMWFSYSRKIMPDTFATSLVMAGMYYGSNYLDRKNSLTYLLLFIVLTMAGLLSKVSTVYAMLLFLPFIWSKEISLKTKLVFSLAGAIVITPVAVWYFYWVPHLVEKFGFWHFYMGKDLAAGFKEVVAYFSATLARFYETAIHFIAFALLLFGLVYAAIKKEKRILVIFALGSAGFLYIIIKAGVNFSHHTYYIIPYVPIMALVCAYGLTQLKKPGLITFMLLAIAVEGVLNEQYDFTGKGNVALLSMEKDLDQFSNRDDLILINCAGHPTPMYFAHRKGWVPSNDELANPAYIDSLKQKGGRYALILKHGFGQDMDLERKLLFSNDDYKIYEL